MSEFVYGSRENSPDYVARGTTIYRIVSDQLGSPRRVVNVDNPADVLFEAEYSSFGEMTMTSGAAGVVPFGFAGGMSALESFAELEDAGQALLLETPNAQMEGWSVYSGISELAPAYAHHMEALCDSQRAVEGRFRALLHLVRLIFLANTGVQITEHSSAKGVLS